MGMGSGKGKAPVKSAEDKAKSVADRKAKIDSAKAAMVERNKVKASKAEAKASTKPAGGMGRGLADLAKKTKAASVPKETAKPAADKTAKLKALLDKRQAAKKPAAPAPAMKCGGKVKKYARGGGIEVRGKTKGKFI